MTKAKTSQRWFVFCSNKQHTIRLGWIVKISQHKLEFIFRFVFYPEESKQKKCHFLFFYFKSPRKIESKKKLSMAKP